MRRLHPWRRYEVAALAAWLQVGCAAAPPPPPPPAPPPEPPASPAPPPAPEPAPEARHECGQDVAAEDPIVEGSLGEGDREVWLINNSGSEIQARLLDGELVPALRGTLRVPHGHKGVFHAPAGRYYVRYRHAESCVVRRGNLLELVGSRSGVEIAINTSFEQGTNSNMRRVKEPL